MRERSAAAARLRQQAVPPPHAEAVRDLGHRLQQRQVGGAEPSEPQHLGLLALRLLLACERQLDRTLRPMLQGRQLVRPAAPQRTAWCADRPRGCAVRVQWGRGGGGAPAENVHALGDRIDMPLPACHAALPPLLLDGLHVPVQRVDLSTALDVVAAAADPRPARAPGHDFCYRGWHYQRTTQAYDTRVQSKIHSLANLAAARATCRLAAAARRSQGRGAQPTQDAGLHPRPRLCPAHGRLAARVRGRRAVVEDVGGASADDLRLYLEPCSLSCDNLVEM